MSEINTQLVREYFELSRFSVLTHWRHADERGRGSESGSLLFVEQVRSEGSDTPPFLLQDSSVTAIHRAVVEVRAWHADKFYPSVIESSPILAHVASDEVSGLARDIFGGRNFSTVLVVSELPASSGPRGRSLELLRGLGIGHILEFATLLAALATRLRRDGNYAPSQTLQTLRLLKRYDLLRRQQLEFAFPLDPPTTESTGVHTDLPDRAAEEADEF